MQIDCVCENIWWLLNVQRTVGK